MKSGFLFVLVLLLNNQNLFSQKRDVDFKYFFYGTLSDYIGRNKCAKYPENADYYYPYEESLMQFNYDYLKEGYRDLVIDSVERRTLKSKVLTEEINKLFKFKFDDGFCSDREDANGELIDSSFVGKIKTEIFKTKQQKISYLVGAYVRYGVKSDTSYSIRIANSLSTFPACMKLLEEIGCKDIRSKIVENIPVGYTIWFTPTKELKSYLSKYMFLRQKLEDELQKMLN